MNNSRVLGISELSCDHEKNFILFPARSVVQTGPLIIFSSSSLGKKIYIFFLPVEFPLLKTQWGVSIEGEEVFGS